MLDDKDFRDDLMQGGDESQAEQSGTVTDPALIPGYRAEDKPTTTDLSGDQSFDLESILADIRNITEGSVKTPVRISSITDEPPVAELDDKQIMREMLSMMRELTKEVKQLRSHIEARPYDAALYPSERPPGIAAGEEDGSAPETVSDAQSEQKKPVKKNKVLSIASSVLFYAVIVVMVLGAFLMRSADKGKPFMIADFSAATILTSSMEDVYPKGSLIITKRVDAKKLQIGDDITFMMGENSSVTHRIIEITENYQETGERAFKTQGTMNSKADKEMVAAANVVGKVVFHSKLLGDFANFVKANWPMLIFALIVIIGLISFLKWNAKRTYDDENNRSEGTPHPQKGFYMKRRLHKSEEEVE